jgi:hypothetical protein
MHTHRIVPILLLAGAAMLFMSHKRHEFMGQCEEGDQPHPIGLHGPHGHHGERSEWGKRVPPLFEMWHKRAHELEQQAQQPSAAAPAI